MWDPYCWRTLCISTLEYSEVARDIFLLLRSIVYLIINCICIYKAWCMREIIGFLSDSYSLMKYLGKCLIYISWEYSQIYITLQRFKDVINHRRENSWQLIARVYSNHIWICLQKSVTIFCVKIILKRVSNWKIKNVN